MKKKQYQNKTFEMSFCFQHRDGRSRSIDLSFSRLGAGSRAEDISGNFENPLYQEFCKRTTEEPTGKCFSVHKRGTEIVIIFHYRIAYLLL